MWEGPTSNFSMIKYFVNAQLIVTCWHKLSLSVYLFIG